MSGPDYEVKITTGTSSVTASPNDAPSDDEAQEGGSVVYVLGPVEASLGKCAGCGCRLQHPGPYDGTKGSIWLTPWMDWRSSGRCTVCAAYDEDVEAQASLAHWLKLNAAASSLEGERKR